MGKHGVSGLVFNAKDGLPMSPRDCCGRIADDLANLGVVTGDTVLVHSSFKSLGPVPGGIETVVQGPLRAVGPKGTLLMPALSWALRPPEVFDVRLTSSNVGANTAACAGGIRGAAVPVWRTCRYTLRDAEGNTWEKRITEHTVSPGMHSATAVWRSWMTSPSCARARCCRPTRWSWMHRGLRSRCCGSWNKIHCV